MLKFSQAVAVCTELSAIRLAYEPAAKAVQPVTLGNDPGRTNIGLDAVRGDDTCLYAARCKTHNRQVPKAHGGSGTPTAGHLAMKPGATA